MSQIMNAPGRVRKGHVIGRAAGEHQVNRTTTIRFQLGAGFVETVLGISFVANFKPLLWALQIHLQESSFAILSLAGMFIFTLGLCGMVGGYLSWRCECLQPLKGLWLVTSIIHSGAATLTAVQLAQSELAAGWWPITSFFAAMAVCEWFLLKVPIRLSRLPENKPFRVQDLTSQDVVMRLDADLAGRKR
jgi:hypothetical protein